MSENTPGNSPENAPPPNPYEPAGPPQEQPPYGQPPQGQPTYGAPPYAQAAYGMPPYYYASWGDRVVATLWDFLYLWPGLLVGLLGIIVTAVGGGIESGLVVAIGVLVMLAGWGWMIWLFIRNSFLDQGRTGWTWGKRKVGIRLIKEVDGTPVGPGMAFVRYLLHSVINQACYIDYLWPLWDAKKQTLTDKVLATVVIKQADASQHR